MIKPKLIIANGCSMASGFECTEPGKQLPQDWEHSWPKQLCDIIGCDGANMSRAGQSNWSIAVNTQSIILQQFKNYKPSDMLVIIGWTEFTRAEFVADDDIFYFNAGFNQNAQQGTLTENLKRYDVQNAYKGWLGQSIDSHMNRFAWTYWGLVHFLKSNNIPYLFFNAISKPYKPAKDLVLCSDPNRHSNEEVWNTLFNDDNYLLDTTQFEWLTTNWKEYTVGAGVGQHHWNPEALQAWANYIAQKLVDK